MSISKIKGGKVDVKIWAPIHEVESQALDQLRNIASLPWCFHHVAVMPDVHLGKGATVGSVIALKNAVSPAAVGVDIGCFTGDTEVFLADSHSYKIKDLVSKGEFVIYSFNRETEKICGAKATAKLTRKNAPLVRVTLDNGKTIKCTPDHKFLLRDGTYKEAKDLSPQESLMPFYSKIDKEGYCLVKQPIRGGWQRAHWTIARSGLLGSIPSFAPQRTIIHHKNFNESDNTPDNLQFMGDADHASYHRSLVDRNQHWHSDDFEDARLEALAKKAKTPEGHAYYAKRGTKNILKYMEDNPEHFRDIVKHNGERGKEYLIKYNQSKKGKSKSKELSNKIFICEICGAEIKSPIGYYASHLPACKNKNRRKRRKVTKNYNNHKVIEVVHLNEKEDVYCLVVPGTNNFALSAGVFVHNCGMMAVKTNLAANDLPDSLKKLRHAIERGIPVGFHQHKDPVKRATKLQLWGSFKYLDKKVQKLKGKAVAQCGTLGGGNHFIELCLDEANTVWLMLHSGSRNIGKTLADIHIKKAKKLAHNAKLPDPDLAVFLAGTPEMNAYRRDLYWAQEYALENRKTMMGIYQEQLKLAFPHVKFENPCSATIIM